MSQALEQDTDTDVEARARSMGWKPKEEYRGPTGAWRDAATFVSKGENDLPILRERLRKQEQDLAAIRKGQDDATNVVLDLTERLRTADERAYKKARERVLAEREQAVEAGDKSAFAAAERELAEIDETKPKPVTKPAPAAPAIAPEVLDWVKDNQWFETDGDMAEAARRIHGKLLKSQPHWSVAENLAEVTKRIRAAFPDNFPGDRAPDPDAATTDDAPPPNPRRAQPASVAASTPTAARPNPKSIDALFAALPPDEKAAFERYRKQIDSKPNAKPLTKEEWLRNSGVID